MRRHAMTLSFTILAGTAAMLVGGDPAQGAGQADPSKGRAEGAAELARKILDDSKAQEEREAIIRDHPQLSAELIAAMTADLPDEVKEQYRRIPWIWRVAIAAGRRNDEGELRKLLEVALPTPGARLDDWRAVVLGGGLINGVSQAGVWPGERFDQVLRGHAGLKSRWDRAEGLAAAMADDEGVATGTRYDALRMLGAGTWDRRGAELFLYLLRGVHPELQQGAVSGLADVKSPAVGQALLSGLGHYSAPNRDLALDAMLRDEDRASALLDAVAEGRLKRSDLGDARIKSLLQHPNPSLRSRAAERLKP